MRERPEIVAPVPCCSKRHQYRHRYSQCTSQQQNGNGRARLLERGRALYMQGFNALKKLITMPRKVRRRATSPFDAQFFATYAPASDNNDPTAYAKAVGRALGVDYKTFKISQ